MNANRILLQHKYANVIETLAKNQNISLRQAMDVFYKSYTYQEMREGISDMHCRSDEYLAEEILLEQKTTDSSCQRQEKIRAYQDCLKSVQQQIEKEKEGLVLDSGTLRPDIVNPALIDELEKKEQRYKSTIADLQKNQV